MRQAAASCSKCRQEGWRAGPVARARLQYFVQAPNLLQRLAVDREIEAGPFFFLACAQRCEQVDQFQQHECDNAGPDQRRAHTVELSEYLTAVALEQACGFANGR